MEEVAGSDREEAGTNGGCFQVHADSSALYYAVSKLSLFSEYGNEIIISTMPTFKRRMDKETPSIAMLFESLRS